jgi:sulfoacetaldehyde acetyltransferase
MKDDDEGTVWNEEARKRDADRMSPRQAWRAIQAGMPDDVIISSDIGNNLRNWKCLSQLLKKEENI